MKRVLIIDDDDAILDALKEALTQEEFQVQTITSVGNIFQVIEEYQPHIILIDYILPEVNGGEICHQIKNTPATSHLPVIIFSAHPKVLNSLGDYGSDVVIEKPFDLNNLINVLKRY